MKNIVITAIVAIVIIAGFVTIYGALAKTSTITGGGTVTQTHEGLGSLVGAALAAIGL